MLLKIKNKIGKYEQLSMDCAMACERRVHYEFQISRVFYGVFLVFVFMLATHEQSRNKAEIVEGSDSNLKAIEHCS